MANFCLPPELTERFLSKLKDGSINPDKLSVMNSADRRGFFSEFLPEEMAKQVNADFESKLLLKNQKAGLVTWAKRTAGLKPEVRRDLLSRVRRMDEVLTPESEDAFLQDLAAQRLGVSISADEAGKISDLAVKAETALGKRDTSEAARMDYGHAIVAFERYVAHLKDTAGKIPVTQQFKDNPLKASWGLAVETLASSRTLKASLDNSYIDRQGVKAMWRHPKIWAKHAIASYKRGVQQFGGQNVMDEVAADIMSRKNFDLYKKAKLAVASVEEEFPGSLPEKIPAIGRAFKASQTAFTSQAQLTRADVFDLYLEQAKKKGIDIKDETFLKALGSKVNALTGRASLPGDMERAATFFNKVWFAPRFFVSNVQTISQIITGAGASDGKGYFSKERNFIRGLAMKQAGAQVAGTMALLAVASALGDDDTVEWDPRSSDFGKIRIGDTRFDVTGGMAPIITLIARGITNSTKSSTTQTVTALNTGEFGSRTYYDVFIDFFDNKLAPVPRIVSDLFQGQNFDGQPMTPANIAKGLFVPIPIETFEEGITNPRAANIFMLMFLDHVGFGANTYSIEEDWTRQGGGVELKAFREHVGDDKEFRQINEEYTKRYNEWFTKLGSNEEYASLPEEDKKDVLSNKKSAIKDDLYKEHGFKYKKAKPKKLPKL